MGKRLSSAGLVVVFVCAASTAAADRKVEAQQLFNEGKALMAEARYADACPKFAASHALAPSASTLMNLGACQEADRKLATAWGTFQEAAALASRTDLPLFEPSRKRAQGLEARLSSLQVDVPASSRVEGLEITRNGVALMEAQWGSRIFVDGGEYEIVARAPGTVAWTARISVASELDRRSVEIPRLVAEETRATEPPPPPATAAVTPIGALGPTPTGPERDDRRGGGLTMKRKVALGLGAAGVAALGGGVMLGLKAKGYQEDSDAICPTTTCNDAEALELNRDARSTGTKASVLFVVGGAAVAGGVVLWILGKPVTPVASRDSVGFLVGGAL